MASTSEVATAPASSGAATRPARTPAVAHGWRVLRTGVAFFTFGVGAIVVAGIVWPLRVLPGGTSARREVAVQRVVRAALHGFVTLETEGGFAIPLALDDSYARLVDLLDRGLSPPRA